MASLKRRAEESAPAKTNKKKRKSKFQVEDESLDTELGLNTLFSRMDNQLLADYLAQKISRFGTDLSPVEVSDMTVSTTAITDSTGFTEQRTLEKLPDFLGHFCKNPDSLAKASKKMGNPHSIIVTGAGLRAADIVRALRIFASKDIAVAKLFAKHMKVDEQVALLKKLRVSIAVGTPARLSELIDNGALSLEGLHRIVVDASHIDQKKRGSLFLCIFGSCPSLHYGPALATAILSCSDRGANISPLLPVEIQSEKLLSRQVSPDYDVSESLPELETVQDAVIDRKLTLALACNAGPDGVVTVSLSSPSTFASHIPEISGFPPGPFGPSPSEGLSESAGPTMTQLQGRPPLPSGDGDHLTVNEQGGQTGQRGQARPDAASGVDRLDAHDRHKHYFSSYHDVTMCWIICGCCNFDKRNIIVHVEYLDHFKYLDNFKYLIKHLVDFKHLVDVQDSVMRNIRIHHQAYDKDQHNVYALLRRKHLRRKYAYSHDSCPKVVLQYYCDRAYDLYTVFRPTYTKEPLPQAYDTFTPMPLPSYIDAAPPQYDAGASMQAEPTTSQSKSKSGASSTSSVSTSTLLSSIVSSTAKDAISSYGYNFPARTETVTPTPGASTPEAKSSQTASREERPDGATPFLSSDLGHEVENTASSESKSSIPGIETVPLPTKSSATTTKQTSVTTQALPIGGGPPGLFVTIIEPDAAGNLETPILTVSEQSPWQTPMARAENEDDKPLHARVDAHRVGIPSKVTPEDIDTPATTMMLVNASNRTSVLTGAMPNATETSADVIEMTTPSNIAVVSSASAVNYYLSCLAPFFLGWIITM
ncbi:kinase-like domain [Cordyceps militaris]|uniref:Kinase-like domain n=1 Tax=Cordyceps militaris TaxID=73501 RepID=A0A2H4SHI6_CORMI|nr:kinase-like domain [Cordyceps militaris]